MKYSGSHRYTVNCTDSSGCTEWALINQMFKRSIAQYKCSMSLLHQ